VTGLRREPPAEVRRELRREVGFGCPVEDCGSPYLTWHHFDPPWNERQHHDPCGMVALCRDHHPEADSGAFTPKQLREFKQARRDRTRPVGARINWMRQQLVAVIGGNFYVDVPVALKVQDMPVVWFGRDEQGNVLVNVQQLTTSGEPRMVMVENFWIKEGSAEHDIECPPSGRLVKATHPNGDRLRVEFRTHDSWDTFERRYPLPDLPKRPPLTFPPNMPPESRELLRKHHEEWVNRPFELPPQREHAARAGVKLPVTTVEVEMSIAGTELKLGPRSTPLPGANVIAGSWSADGQVGVQIN
jgi:hypothetical protein